MASDHQPGQSSYQPRHHWRDRLADPAHPVWPIVRVFAVALLVKLGSSSFDSKEMMAIVGYAGAEGTLANIVRHIKPQG